MTVDGRLTPLGEFLSGACTGGFLHFMALLRRAGETRKCFPQNRHHELLSVPISICRIVHIFHNFKMAINFPCY